MRSLGLEVLEAVPDPDVVVVCCGGGGLLAGVAAAVKLSGCDTTRIYGVEPEGGEVKLKNGRPSAETDHRRRARLYRVSVFATSLYDVPKLY